MRRQRRAPDELPKPTSRVQRLQNVSKSFRKFSQCQLTISKHHALLADHGKVVFVDCRRIVALVPKVTIVAVSGNALVWCYVLVRCAAFTYKSSSHWNISSAYWSALSRGTAPFTTAKPSLRRSSRKSPKDCSSFAPRRKSLPVIWWAALAMVSVVLAMLFGVVAVGVLTVAGLVEISGKASVGVTWLFSRGEIQR
jgi:hypothetical protein